MSNLDLGNALDFARATLSGASTILQQFGRDPAEWDIVEAAYLSDFGGVNSQNASDSAYVIFHVFKSKSPYQAALDKVQDTGGRRKAKYMFPYQDGQTTDDLGRMPEEFQLSCLIHGPRYLEGFNRLMQELQKPGPGTLIHPVRGRVKVAFINHQITHTHEKSQAVEINLTFTEHSFSLNGPLRDPKSAGVKSALASALEAFAKIDEILAKVEGAVIFVRTLKNNIETLLNALKGNYAKTLTNLNLTYNPGSSADIPGLLPINNGGIGDDGSIVNTFPVTTSPSDPFASVPIADIESSTASSAIATETLKKEVNARRDEINTIISTISSGAGGAGSLEFYDEILLLKVIGINLQEVLERGVASSKASVIEYKTPRIMSIREIAFANGVSPDRSIEIDLLNPELESVNQIEKGTTVKVPVT